jgi:hypothetical protein
MFAACQSMERPVHIKTYSNRHNARRAGVQAGIPPADVAITVHKQGNTVRFGFACAPAPSASAMPHIETALVGKPPANVTSPSAEAHVRNGVRRRSPGGVCRQVWDWLDANPSVSARAAREAAPLHGWNSNNVVAEFYAWRKYNAPIADGASVAVLPA